MHDLRRTGLMVRPMTESDREALIERRVADLVRPEIQALKSYHVADASGLVKLDAMENPFNWPQELVHKWQELQGAVAVNRYPDPQATGVKRLLRDVYSVPAELEILLGNGSDELIQLLALAAARPGATLLSPEPGFVMYRMIAEFAGMDYAGVSLRPDWQLDMPAMLDAIARHQPALVFLALPNNPTGNLFAEADVAAIVEATPGIVVLDEAYTAFTGADYLAWASRYDNVLVMRTLSKVGLAGLRLGMLFGKPPWLAELDKLRLPYNIGVITQSAAEFALAHFGVFEEQTRELRDQRAALLERLARLEGLRVFPSEANFLVVQTLQRSARDVWEALRASGVLVKNLDGSHPLLENCLRITVGSGQENDILLQAMAAALS